MRCCCFLINCGPVRGILKLLRFQQVDLIVGDVAEADFEVAFVFFCAVGFSFFFLL